MKSTQKKVKRKSTRISYPSELLLGKIANEHVDDHALAQAILQKHVDSAEVQIFLGKHFPA